MYDVVVQKVHVRYLIFWWVSCNIKWNEYQSDVKLLTSKQTKTDIHTEKGEVKPTFLDELTVDARLSHVGLFSLQLFAPVIFTASLTKALGERRPPPRRFWFRSGGRVWNLHTAPDFASRWFSNLMGASLLKAIFVVKFSWRPDQYVYADTWVE